MFDDANILFFGSQITEKKYSFLETQLTSTVSVMILYWYEYDTHTDTYTHTISQVIEFFLLNFVRNCVSKLSDFLSEISHVISFLSE